MNCSVEILAERDTDLKQNYSSTKYQIVSQEERNNLNRCFLWCKTDVAPRCVKITSYPKPFNKTPLCHKFLIQR